MHFEFLVRVDVERVQGKFAPKSEIEEQLVDALDQANPGSIIGEQDGEYEVTDWAVDDAMVKVKK